MKIRYFLVSSVAVAIAGFMCFGIFGGSTSPKYFSRDFLSKYSERITCEQDWNLLLKMNAVTGIIDVKDIEKAINQVKQLKSNNKSTQTDLSWTEMGPDNVGGRTRTILIDKDNPNLMFAGGVAGGLWKSTTGGQSWNKVSYSGDANSTGINSTDILANLSISCITQAPNGDIYFGTGEWFAGLLGRRDTISGFEGQGIWKSTDRGQSFSRLSSTWSTPDSKLAFCAVNAIAVSPVNSNRVYAATLKGLMVSDDAGTSWHNGVTTEGDNVAEAVAVSKTGFVIVSIMKGHGLVTAYKRSTYISNDGNSFAQTVIDTSAYRTEFAISPQDDNYIYAMCAQSPTMNSENKLLGVYLSTNKGLNWSKIQGSGLEFNILGKQGHYDNVIAVFPNDKSRIICGGTTNLWTFSPAGGWEPITSGGLAQTNPMYVHSNHHTIVFHPTDPNTLYIGTDGGIFKSSDGAFTFVAMNKGYNITQFYSVGFSGDGRLIGGTSYNGTQYCDFTGNTKMNFSKIKDGDGGYCEITTLKPEVSFGSSSFGSLTRSEIPGGDLNDNNNDKYFFSQNIMADFWGTATTSYQNIASPNYTGYNTVASFVTPIALWESYADSLSSDLVVFTADRNYSAGETVHGKSKMNHRDLPYILNKPLIKDSTLRIQDIYQSVLALGMTGVAGKHALWITRNALDFSVKPSDWYPVVAKNHAGKVTTLVFSKCGNYIYFSDLNNVYRVSNLNYARTKAAMYADTVTCLLSTQKIASFPNAIISSIAVNPSNANNLVVTLGGYSDTGGKIWYSTNAALTTDSTTAGNFVSKDDFVFPVYSALIVWNDSKKVIIGTEYGIYATDDITAPIPAWSDQNNNEMGNVPVYMLRQQLIRNTWVTGVLNHGFIYAATHGRGIWKCETFKGPVGVEENNSETALSNVSVYPNPAKDYTHVSLELSHPSDVLILVSDIQGRQVKKLLLSKQGEGSHTYPVNVSDLKAGSYFISTIAQGKRDSKKIIVY